MSSTTLENCIGYTAEGNHALTMCFNFNHLKVDYKDCLLYTSTRRCTQLLMAFA